MAIWKLSPVDLKDPDWAASSHRGPVIVRARDEDEARRTAAEAFDVKVGFKLREGVKAPPWRRPALVRVEPIEDPRFEAEGPADVLDPSFPEASSPRRR